MRQQVSSVFGAAAAAALFTVSGRRDEAQAGLFPKMPGETPQNLGPRGGGNLALCPETPNCFSTTTPKEDQVHFMAPLKFNKSPDEAWSQIVKVIETYPIPNGGIDGGGKKIITLDNEKKYLYAQFESKLFGFVDDFELSMATDQKAVYLRSASRLGDSDFGVNSKRINWMLNELKLLGGWDVKPVEGA